MTAAQRKFRHHYNLEHHDRVSSHHAIKSWVKHFKDMGSALKMILPKRNRTKRSTENIEAVKMSFEDAHSSINLNNDMKYLNF